MTLTPEQFNMLATKEDLKSLEVRVDKKIDKLTVEVLSIREDSKNFVTKDEFKKGVDDILTVLDGIAKRIGDSDTERISNIAAHDRFQRDIDQIKTQIKLPTNA